MVILLLFHVLAPAGAFLICWFTTGLWVSQVADCGPTQGKFLRDVCNLHVVTVQGRERFWSCSDEHNEFLQDIGLFIQPHLAVYDSPSSHTTEFLITVPVDPVNVSIYLNPEDLPSDYAFDAIQRITFIPKLQYTVDGSLADIETVATPQLSYERGYRYSSSLENSNNAFSGGPLAASSDVVLHYSATASSSASSCGSFGATAYSSIMQEYDRFFSTCSPETLRVYPVHLRHLEGGLSVLNTGSIPRNIGDDLGLLNAFTWRIVVTYPSVCVPHSTQVGYRLKYLFIQLFLVSWVLHGVLYLVRGLLATNGAIDLTAFYQARLTGSRERFKSA